MIEATEMLARMGKEKFIEMATHSQRGPRMFDIDRKRSRGKNVKFHMCQHGIWTIDNYKMKFCKDCGSTRITIKAKRDIDYTGFNQGLGCYTEGYSDWKKAAKMKGATYIGDDKL